jgi:hypothetical protein
VDETQLELFDAKELAATRRRAIRAIRARQIRSDPEVAEAAARSTQLGCDLRSAFASFWAGLTPERRQELRARLAA